MQLSSGIHRRLYQPGMMYSRPLKSAFTTLRAQVSGRIRKPVFFARLNTLGGKPISSVATPAGAAVVTTTPRERISRPKVMEKLRTKALLPQ